MRYDPMKCLNRFIEEKLVGTLGEVAYVGDEIYFGNETSTYKIVQIHPYVEVLLPKLGNSDRIRQPYESGIRLDFRVKR